MPPCAPAASSTSVAPGSNPFEQRHANEEDRAFLTALRHALLVPVCALRASMEALARELPARTEPALLLRGALEEVGRIDRRVAELVEYTTTPRVRPIPSSPREVLHAAIDSLPAADRRRVLSVATVEVVRPSLDVPLLGRALRRVVENALEASTGQVLVVLRALGTELEISVLDEAATRLEPAQAFLPFHTTKVGHLGLGLALARRDLGLHGGELDLHELVTAGTCVTLRVPLASDSLTARTAA